MIIYAIGLIIFLSIVVVTVYKYGYEDGLRDGRAENYKIYGDRRKKNQSKT